MSLKRFPLIALAAFVLSGGMLVSPAAAGDDRSAADLLPATTIFYAEVARTAEVARLVLDHPLRDALEALPAVRRGRESPEATRFYDALAAIEKGVGLPPRRLLETITAGGAAFAVDPATRGGVLLARTSDEQVLARLVEFVVTEARRQAEQNGRPDPVRIGTHRGIQAYRLGDARFAVLGPWLLVTNQDELGQAMIDQYLEADLPALAGDELFRSAHGRASAGRAAWAFLRVRTLRELGVARDLFRGRSPDPGAELLLGGVLAALGKAPFATLELTTASSGTTLALAVPHDLASVPARQRFFFAPSGEPSAARPLAPAGSIVSVSAYRDVGTFWLSAPDLFGEAVNARMAKAEGDLMTFLGGRSLGTDVLARMDPRIQFHLARYRAEADAPQPAIRLPAGALAIRMRNAEAIRPTFHVVFQTLVGLTNLQAASKNRPMLIVQSDARDAVSVLSSRFLPRPGQETTDEGEIFYNFTPTLATVGDWFILSSTASLARDLAGRAQEPAAAESLPANTSISIDTEAVAAALSDNRDHVVAQRMLQTGADEQEAAAETDALLKAVRALGNMALRLTPDEGRGELRLEVEIGMQ